MTDTAIIALVTALPATIASVAAAIVSLASLRKSRENGEKSDTIIKAAAEIHTLTNSRLSKVTTDLDVALSKIAGLEARLQGMSDAKTVADHVAARLAETRSPLT